MKLYKMFFFIINLLIFSIIVNAQNPDENLQKFAGKQLSFSYPSGWAVTDHSSPHVQQLNITPNTGNALILVIVYQDKISEDTDISLLKLQITQPRMEKIFGGFRAATQDEVCMEMKETKISGQRVSGLYGEEQSAGESYSFVMDNKFVNLIYLRENKISSEADAVWNALLKTLKVNNKESKSSVISDLNNNNLFNGGKVMDIPEPIVVAGRKEGSSIVRVRVKIDESGNVISAKGIEGDVTLYPAAIESAKKARFTPSYMCGKPVKIQSTILYRFVFKPMGQAKLRVEQTGPARTRNLVAG